VWLKHYTSWRFVEPGQNPGFIHNVATFAISAFWHGFYPGYYIAFVLAFFCIEAAKDLFKMREQVLHRLIPNAIVRRVLANLFTMY
jgi:hypothetical protein